MVYMMTARKQVVQHNGKGMQYLAEEFSHTVQSTPPELREYADALMDAADRVKVCAAYEHISRLFPVARIACPCNAKSWAAEGHCQSIRVVFVAQSCFPYPHRACPENHTDAAGARDEGQARRDAGQRTRVPQHVWSHGHVLDLAETGMHSTEAHRERCVLASASRS